MDVMQAPAKPASKPGERYTRVEATDEFPAYWHNGVYLEAWHPGWESISLQRVLAFAESLGLDRVSMNADRRGQMTHYSRADGVWTAELVSLGRREDYYRDEKNREWWAECDRHKVYHGKQERRHG